MKWSKADCLEVKQSGLEDNEMKRNGVESSGGQ